MNDDRNNGIFDEFDFMYRHKSILKEQEEQRIKKEQEEKQAAEAAARAAAASSSPEPKKKTAATDKKKTAAKKNTVKRKQTESKQSRKPEKEEKKIHPEYGKPYKKDTGRDRKRAGAEKRERINKKYKKEKELIDQEKDKRTRAERLARLRTVMTRAFIYLLIAAGVAAVMLGISYGAIRLVLGFRRKADHLNIAYQVGLASDMQRVPYDTYIRDGIVYVCGNDIVNLCGFTVTGTSDEIKYISPDDGNDTVMFYTGTNRAVINKNEIRLRAATSYEDGKLYIPMSFFSSYSTGLVCEYTPETDNSGAVIKVYKHMLNEYEKSVTGTAAVYEPVTFRLKESAVLAKIDESALADEIGEATYKIDVSKYTDAINPKKLYGYISVINSDHPASGTLEYDDLTQICIQAESIEEPILLRRIAAQALEAMFLEIRGVEDLTKFNVYSGYNTFESSKAKDPSLDESLLGLSVEVSFGGDDDGFEDSRTYKWFAENSYKYGFIIRYPKGKTSSTGVKFNPRILRYVGRYVATKMHNEGLSLEEFIEKYELEQALQIQKGE